MKTDITDFGASENVSFKVFAGRCLRSEPKNVVLSLLFSVLGIAFSLGSAYSLKILVDEVLIAHKVEWLWPIQGFFILAVMLGNACRLLESHFALGASSQITYKIRRSMFERLLLGRLSDLEKINRGDFTSSLFYDAGAVMDYFSNNAIAVYSSILHIVLSLALMFYLSPLLTVLTVFIIPIMSLVFSTLDKYIAAWNSRLIEARKHLSGGLYQVLGGLIPVRVTQTEAFQRGRFTSSAQKHLDLSRRLSLLYIFYGMATWMLIMVPY